MGIKGLIEPRQRCPFSSTNYGCSVVITNFWKCTFKYTDEIRFDPLCYVLAPKNKNVNTGGQLRNYVVCNFVHRSVIFDISMGWLNEFYITNPLFKLKPRSETTNGPLPVSL